MQEIWITSDTHFGHKNIIKYENRPFADTNEMDEVLIENWNKVVKPNDLIFHLGDVFFCKSDRMEYIASRLNGRKILIRGNHDRGISNEKFRKLGFDVYNYYFLDGYILSHKPIGLEAMKVAMHKGFLKGNMNGHLHSQIQDMDKSVYKCVCTELTSYTPIGFNVAQGQHLMSRFNGEVNRA